MTPIELQSIGLIWTSMLFTVDSQRSKIFAPLAAPGEAYWSSAEVCLHRPWFLATILEGEEGGHEIKRTMLVFDVESLDSLSSHTPQSEWRMISVELITPGHMNSTGLWQMQHLERIELYEEPEHVGQLATVYVTADGGCVVESFVGTPLHDLRNPELRFVAP